MTPASNAIAVIVDIAGSRQSPDRAALQATITDAFGRVNEILPGSQPLAPTVGDEFQAEYPDLHSALRATLLARLFLPEGVDCRFGLGEGEVRTIGTGVAGVLQDGSAWWAARKAIDEAWKQQHGKLGFVRTWFRASSEPLDGIEAIVNAYLLGRDQIIGGMNARARRLLRGQLLGQTQAQLAADEGITQSAVSQSLARSGANALVAGEALLAAATPGSGATPGSAATPGSTATVGGTP